MSFDCRVGESMALDWQIGSGLADRHLIGLGLEMNWQLVDGLVLDRFRIGRLEWIGAEFSLDWQIGIELVNRNSIGDGLV